MGVSQDMFCVPPAITEMPPATRLVAFSLGVNGEQTQREIIATTGLAQRTVRNALDRMDDRDIIEERINMHDARQTVYALDRSLDVMSGIERDVDAVHP